MWISIIRFLFLLLLILQAVIGAVWERRPHDISASVGSNVTLTCKVRGEPGYVTWNKNGNTIAVGTSIIPNDNRISIPDDTKYNLVITDLKQSDDSNYTCTVQNLLDTQKSVTVHLTVLLPPGQPTISINDTRPVKVENDVVALTCLSTEGNPPPTFKWTKNGLVLNSNIVETKVPKETSSSQLTVHLDYSDHLASYSCTVQNSVNQDNPLSVSIQLQVLYHPRITFSPYKDLSIELGKTGSLSCNVSANPAVTSVSWKKDGQPVQTSSSRINFLGARKEDTGTYTCSTVNTINGQTKSVTDTATVDVIYAPVIDVPSVFVVNESATLDIVCKVDANPPAYYTRWQKIDNSIQTNNAQLIVDNIKRSYKGNYSCIARNAMKPSGKLERIAEKTSYTYLYVKYSPGSSNVNPVSPVYVGDSLTLTCSVTDPGYPTPTYKWQKLENNQILPTTTSQLTINGVTLQDNGNYSCTPNNMMGNGGTSTVHVIVNEKPTFVDAHQDKDTIYNNRTGYWLQCKVRGRPQPVIQWYKNGNPLDTSGKLYRLQTTVTSIDTFSSLVTSQVYLQGSDRIGTTTPMISDVANYTCKDTGSNLAHTMELYIYFPPKQSDHQKVAAIAGGSAKLTCVGEGYPVPTFVWKRNNVVLNPGGRVTIESPKFVSVTKSESVVQIDRIVSYDFGDYTCEMTNQFGRTSKIITLTVKSKPEAPTGLLCPRKNWDSVTLRWTPGFNGGSYQTFRVKYKSNPPTTEDQTVSVLPNNATEFTVSNLFPNTAYEFRICGYNELGEGALSKSITVTSDVYTFPFLKEIPEYSADNKELMLNLNVNNTYCVKVKVSTNGGQSWETYTNEDLECFDANAEMMIITTTGINRMNLSLCLVSRIEVCGTPVSVQISQTSTPDLTETEVIIIGCVCAAILIALLTVLVCIIIRRRKLAKQLPPQARHSVRFARYDKYQTVAFEYYIRPPNLAANGHAMPPQKPLQGYENTDSDLNRNGYPPFPRQNGNVPLDTSYDPEFENEMNRRNANKSSGNYYNEKQQDISFTDTPRSPTKERQFIDIPSKDRKGDFINCPESGYNTQDNPKPKKHKPKPFEANLNHSSYYSDSLPFAHDPPGHTCGLPCCNRDLHIHLKLSGYQGGCMSMPFQVKPEKQDNFTFRQKRAGLIMGRPTFSNKFNSLQPGIKSQKRKSLPVFGSLRESDVSTHRLHELSGNQRHYLKERGITLPRMHMGESSSDFYRIQEEADESSDSSDSEADYYRVWECNGMDSEIQVKSPSALKNTEKIYPWTLLENAQTKPNTDDKNEPKNQDVPFKSKYGSLPMCYKDLTEAHATWNDQKPMKQSETKVFTLHFDKNRLCSNGKSHTIERTTATPSNNIAYGKTVRIADEQPKTKSSTLPRSSIRIRPILKNRIENIYTDLITSAAVSGRPTTDNEEDHNYEKIRDEDLWRPNIKTKTPLFIKPDKNKPGPKRSKEFYSYENAGFNLDEVKDRRRVSDVKNSLNNPITLIL